MATTAERLKLLYEVSHRLASFDDLDGLLRFVISRTRELFDVEGCAILLHDAERKQLYFPVASADPSLETQAAKLAEARFPADRGIAGWCLTHAKAAIVADAASDPRFYRGVDDATTMTTQALMCAPLGTLGVIEVINPRRAPFTPEDIEFLETLAADVTVAYEKARLKAELQAEVLEVRQLARLGGLGLAAVGLVLSLGAVMTHQAFALPLSELPGRPGVLAGGATLVVGVALYAAGRGRVGRRRATPR